MESDWEGFVISRERYEALVEKARLWEERIGTVAPNADGTVSVSGYDQRDIEVWKADAQLGALVRRMPSSRQLTRDGAGGWWVIGGGLTRPANTPEEALRAAMMDREEKE